jgi:hypothetical protein
MAKLKKCLISFSILALDLACTKNGGELSETLAWMDNTYNPHKGWTVGHGITGWWASDKSRPAGEYLVSGSTETFTHHGCQIALHIQENPYADAFSEIYTTYSRTFNLHDINPQSINVSTYTRMGGFSCENHTGEELERQGMNCNEALITFSTHTEAPLIDKETHTTFPKLQGKDHLSSSKSKETKAFFEVDDVEYARRLAKAFGHAVELCGGKGSGFSGN